MDILKKTQSDYNLIAEHFSQTRRFIWQDLRPFLKLVRPGDKVLDAGCGTGRLATALQSRKINYLGLDFSQKQLDCGRRQNPGFDFQLADLTEAQTWQGLKDFDICFCIAVLHHLPTPDLQLEVLRRIRAALKKNGWLVLSVWNLWQRRFWRPHLDQLRWKINRGGRWRWLQVPYQSGPKLVVNRFYYAFTPWELKKLVKKAGFQVEKVTTGRNFFLLARS